MDDVLTQGVALLLREPTRQLYALLWRLGVIEISSDNHLLA